MPTARKSGPEAELGRIIDQVAAATPARRREMIADLQDRLTPALQAHVADRAAAALKAARTPSRRAGLAAILAGLGRPAVAVAELELIRSRTGWQQAAFAGVLERVGPRLPPAERSQLLITLLVAAGRPADAQAAERISQAAAAVRASL